MQYFKFKKFFCKIFVYLIVFMLFSVIFWFVIDTFSMYLCMWLCCGLRRFCKDTAGISWRAFVTWLIGAERNHARGRRECAPRQLIVESDALMANSSLAFFHLRVQTHCRLAMLRGVLFLLFVFDSWQDFFRWLLQVKSFCVKCESTFMADY